MTPIEETLGAMNELVDEGKVRFIGSSNFEAGRSTRRTTFANDRGWTRFVSAQNEYSLLERGAEEELLPICERLGIGVLPYFPLASGLLTGKYRRGEPAPGRHAARAAARAAHGRCLRPDRGARDVRRVARDHAARRSRSAALPPSPRSRP